MKIAILKKPYCIEIEEQKMKDTLEPNEIRAKTVVSALKLGTDRGNYEGAEDVPGAPTYPRWVGDSNFMPIVGQTEVIMQGLYDTYDLLKPEFDLL